MGLYGSPDLDNVYRKIEKNYKKPFYKNMLNWVLAIIDIFILLLMGISKNNILAFCVWIV